MYTYLRSAVALKAAPRAICSYLASAQPVEAEALAIAPRTRAAPMYMCDMTHSCVCYMTHSCECAATHSCA